MITYDELVPVIANNLEISTTDTERITRFNILANLNAVQLELLNSLRKEFLTSAMKTVRFNVVSGVPDYQFPDEYIRFFRLWVDYNNPITYANPGKEALEYMPERHNRPINELTSQNFPMVDLNTEAGFLISPVPDANVTNGFRLRFIYKIPEITSVQPSLLFSRFRTLLIDGATARSAATDNYRPDLAKFHDELYQRALKMLIPKEGGM